jgi:hypothetical protein
MNSPLILHIQEVPMSPQSSGAGAPRSLRSICPPQRSGEVFIPDTYRPSKAAGSIRCALRGAYEMLVNLEADPLSLSYRPYNFCEHIPRRLAASLQSFPAFEVRHDSGLYVLVAADHAEISEGAAAKAFKAADLVLSARHIWLLRTDIDLLRLEPRWSNALNIAACVHEEIFEENIRRLIDRLELFPRLTIATCTRLMLSQPDPFAAILRLISVGLITADLNKTLALSTEVSMRLDVAENWPRRERDRLCK